MCGIFGWMGQGAQVPAEVIKQMSALLRHRGPNDEGLECGPGWGLGFRRLSILDLSPLGHQPMRTDDGRFQLVFNGEIYNYLELRQGLEREGERFQGGSDTEVLLRLLARKGVQALSQLNGMFALALIDTERRTYLLARDRLGVKPLYYYPQAGHLRFASELKILLAWPNAPRQVDPAAVVEYMALNYLPNELSIFKGYQKLAPGHFMTGALDNPERGRIESYWQLSLNPDETKRTLTERELDALLALLTDAVNIRLRSDVPVGVFLSGGVDSGLVATLAGSTPGTRPLALTVGFAEKDFDETALARATAAQAGLEHQVIVQRPAKLADIDRLAWFFDEPFGDASALPTFALCEAAARHAIVFLSGDGGDEAFAGYRRYIEPLRYPWLAQLPFAVTSILRSLAHRLPPESLWGYRLLKSSLPDAGFAAAFDTLPSDPALLSVLHPDLRPLAAKAGQSLWVRWGQHRTYGLTARQQLLDFALYLPDDILVKMDRASMANSIEVRSPFLDYRLIEWAAKLPRSVLLNAQQGKLPLRQLGARMLPTHVQSGKKRGFGVPLGAWFRQPAGQQFLRERLLSSEARQFGFWDPQGVAHLIAAHQAQAGRGFEGLLWRLLMLDAWSRQYLDGKTFLAGPPAA